MLTPTQLDQYHRDGVLLGEGVADEATLAAMRRALAELIAQSAAVTQHNDIYDLEPDHSAANPRLRRIKHPHKRHPIFREFCTREPLLVVPGSHNGTVHDHNADGRFCGAIDPERVQLPYDKAIPCVGKAGTISIHHTFAVHGSAANTSPSSRPFLLYEFMAADAWPLMGVRDLDEFDSRMICGEKTYSPRMEAVPVRLPLPAAENLGSIYENQNAVKNRYFTAEVVAS